MRASSLGAVRVQERADQVQNLPGPTGPDRRNDPDPIAARRRVLTTALAGLPPAIALDVVADELAELAWQETLTLAAEEWQ